MSPAVDTPIERQADRLADHQRLRCALYDSLRASAEPALVFPEATISAASLWVASRLWVDLFRKHGLQPGDRVVLQHPASPGFLAFLIAAIWEGLSTAVIPPGMTPAQSIEFFDARLGLGCDGLSADDAGCPDPQSFCVPRDSHLPKTPDARLFMRTCGTSGCPGWVALSDSNIWSVLDSHRPHLVRRDDVVLSVLPWFHSFGLIIDLLPALLGAGIIVREPSAGKDPASILITASRYNVTWCSMVPLQTQRLADTQGGLAFLRSLRGGVIGGASASRDLAAAIAHTNLFVGYGQTEASPGVTLGQPGRWIPGAIGKPVGCELRIEPDGRLLVKGKNVSYGKWTPEGVTRFPADRWLDTGDLVVETGDDLIFLGRIDNNFKLANGKMVDALVIEKRLRDADPRIIDCALISADSFSFRLYLVMKDPSTPVDHAMITACLGSLADRLDATVILPNSEQIRTPKGSLDRLLLRCLAQSVKPAPRLAA